MANHQAQVLKQLQRTVEMLERGLSHGSVLFDKLEKEIAPDLDARLNEIAKSLGTEGIDPFGLDPAALRKTALGAALLYRYYFRCETIEVENIPDGPVILVANHGGQLPIDGLMISTALLLERTPPRLTRTMMDYRVQSMPFVSTFFARVGVTLGTPDNARRLLGQNAALLTFPEGMAGITKTIDKAYQLQKFGLGFMRLALLTGAPIVPVSVVGSEEQYPALYNLKGTAKTLGLPALPIWAQIFVPALGLLPLPVKYHLEFGEPMHFEGDPDDMDAVLDNSVSQVKDQINTQIIHHRTNRRSVFF